jgi:hypothetical protein
MPDVRTPGKRGRLPAVRGDAVSPLRFVHEYATLPAPAYPIDVSAGITDWGMLGNGPDPACTSHPDGVGDCTFAGRQHLKMAKAAAGGETEKWETSNALVAEYLAYDHGQDEGANIADLLLSWYKAGKILAFAPVDHGDPAAVEAQHSSDYWVTWGALQGSTKEWTAACLDEAWVIITQEDADAASLDITALRADIDALGGTGAPADPPAPEPASDPFRAELEEIFGRIRAAADKDIGTVVRVLRQHGF